MNKIMGRKYQLVGVLFAFSLLAGTGCKQQVDSLVAGTLINCATHSNEVTCWGIFGGFRASDVEEQGWTYNPLGFVRKEFVNPVVTVGYAHFCVLDQNEVACHLNNEDGQTEVPELSNPYGVAAGEDFTCALDDTGVVCWGRSGILDIDDISFENPRDLVAGKDHICLTDDNGFQCHGFTWMGGGDPTPPDFVTNPSMVTTSPDSGITCALQDEWICWGTQDLRDSQYFFDSPDADIVVPAFQQTCALKDDDITCKGYGMIGPMGLPVPEVVKRPTQLDIAGVHACVVGGFG
ncbi:MAG: hypothetical protein MI867_25445, partial [Pseudomonadales bacterium]|nr:hypothetical protein [Pseudomonadales bacterium]